MPKISDILDEQTRRIEGIPDELIRSIEKSEKATMSALNKALTSLETENGILLTTPKNYAQIEQIKNVIRQTFFSESYRQAVRKYSSEFDEAARLNLEYITESFSVNPNISDFSEIVTQAKTSAVNQLNLDAINKDLTEPISSYLTTSISSKTSLTETISAIQTMVIGSSEKASNYLGVRKTLINDAYSNFDREYMEAMFSDIEVEWRFYQGGTISDTRCFCAVRHGKYYPESIIREWGDGKKIGRCKSGKHWQGANRNTNSGNIFTFVGGYNCKHRLVPVSADVVPASTKKKYE